MNVGDKVKVIDSKHKRLVGKEFVVIGFSPSRHVLIGQYLGQGVADAYMGEKQLEIIE